MYKHNLKPHGEYLAKAQSLPQNTSADGNGAVLDLRNTLGGVEIVAKVNEAITIASAKTLTVKLQHKDDGGSYADLATLYTATGAQSLAAGAELGRFIPPTTVKANLKTVLVTDDSAAAGKVDVYPTYLAR